jgi:protein SCO1/2
MKRVLTGGLALLLLAIAAACRPGEQAFPDYGAVPRFQLVAQDGTAFDSNRLAGDIWVADFFFSNCGSVCPRMSSQMHQVQQAVYRMPDVRLVSFTVDPSRDTPAALAEYAKLHHASPGRWFFLTGRQDTLQMLDKDAFKLGDVDGNLAHSTRFVLVDRSAHIRGYYDTSEADSIPKLIADIHALARQSS